MLGPALAKITAGFILASTGFGQCPPQGSVDVTVKIDEKPAVISTELSSKEIHKRFDKMPDNYQYGRTHITNGATDAEVTAHLSPSFKIQLNPAHGVACMSFKEVTYTLRYHPEIFIASDVKNLGCHYSVALTHEKRHVDIDQRTLNDYLPRIREKILATTAVIGPQGPYLREQVISEKQRIIESLSSEIRPLLDELRTARRTRHAAIDTAENYRRDHAVCAGVINQPIRKQ